MYICILLATAQTSSHNRHWV